MLINGLVIAVIIWLVGVSVKDFACIVVEQYNLVDQDKQAFFNQTMHFYLLRASLAAIIVAGLIYFFLIRNLHEPLKKLTSFTQMMKNGDYPPQLQVYAKDEIGQLSHHFNQMVSTLKRIEMSRKQMIHDISHDLRTPLSNLNGYLEGLSTGVIQGDKTLFQSLHEEAKHLTNLVEQLHQLAIWESELENEIQFQPLSMKELIINQVQSFELDAAMRKMNIETELDEGEVLGSKTGIKQVLTNLIQNALQYDRGGYVKIEGRCEQKVYCISVTNEGQPISEEEARLIFERFYRTDPSRQRETGGAGLGLPIAKQIVKQHGGQIGLSTNQGRHTFWFTLPLIT